METKSNPTSIRNSARIFALKLLLFAGPFVVLLAPAFIVMEMSGEFADIESVVSKQTQAGDEVLYGPAYTNQQPFYKLRMTQVLKPQSLIIGTSRVMQIRPAWFKESMSSYNAGGGVEYFWQIREFLERLPSDQRPRRVLIGLDPWDFNDAFSQEHFSSRRTNYAHDDPRVLQLLEEDTWHLYKDIRDGKVQLGVDWQDRRERPAIGLSAICNGAGFRKDGSHKEANIPNSLEDRFRDTMERIGKSTFRFEISEEISDARILALRELLEYCREKNINVVAFLPPFPHRVIEELKKRRASYSHIFELQHRLEPLFKEFNFHLSDFHDMSDFGVSDVETIDGFHANERTYAAMLLKLGGAHRPFLEWLDVKMCENAAPNGSSANVLSN